MSHEKQRRERIELIVNWVEKAGSSKYAEIAARISMVTGCSLARANEYIQTAVNSKVLELSEGKLSIPLKQAELHGA